MNKKIISSAFLMLLCLLLSAAAGLCEATSTETIPADGVVISMDGTVENPVVLGEGEKVFLFTVTDLEGLQSVFEIHTDAATVGEALITLGLIAGDNGAYGLYVMDVCGIHAAFEENGHYWCFLINGEMAMTGVDGTKITDGVAYGFSVY